MLANGHMVVDMGRNFGGVVKIDLLSEGGGANTSAGLNINRGGAGGNGTIISAAGGGGGTIALEVKYGELLFANGSVNPLTSTAGQIKKPGCCGACAPPVAYQRDVLILPNTIAAPSVLSFTPEFTWHGFRFIEISVTTPSGAAAAGGSAAGSAAGSAGSAGSDSGTGLPVGLTLNITGIPFATSVGVTGEFECGSDMLNDIYDMALNTHLSNMMGQQSDCPHR